MSKTLWLTLVSEWTGGIPCILLGCVNFISSEVSLVSLSILAFSRMISIERIGGMTYMTTKIKRACVSAWAVIMILVSTYVVYLLTHNRGVHNNLCILLGISNQRFVSQVERAFQVVFIFCNGLWIMCTYNEHKYGVYIQHCNSVISLAKAIG